MHAFTKILNVLLNQKIPLSIHISFCIIHVSYYTKNFYETKTRSQVFEHKIEAQIGNDNRKISHCNLWNFYLRINEDLCATLCKGMHVLNNQSKPFFPFFIRF